MYIGINCLGLPRREVGRLTLTLFNKLYKHYKNNWDLEMMLRKAGKTYAELFIEEQKELEWF